MKINISSNLLDAVNVIKTGGLIVAKTDTLYGVLASVKDEKAIDRIYNLKNRSKGKQLITLISTVDQIDSTIPRDLVMSYKKYWPGPVTIVFPTLIDEKLRYEYENSRPYRMPDSDLLIKFINKVGPLVAPSANPEGLTPAETIEQAVKYFGDSIDLYIDSGSVTGSASKIIKILPDGKKEILR